MYKGIVERRGRTRFNFQYVPEVGKKTGKENHHLGSMKQSFAQSLRMLARMGPIEFLFLAVILAHGYLAVLVGKSLINYIY